ncbi:cyclic lactone autoinducer peptide [Clostridioides mangenotii]
MYLKVSANSICFYLSHQPELPKNLDKFKKKSE